MMVQIGYLLGWTTLIFGIPFLLDKMVKAFGRSLNDKPGTKHGRWF